MKSGLKIGIAVVAGAVGAVGGLVTLAGWRQSDVQKQTLERQVRDLERQISKFPKALQIGGGGDH